MNTHTNRLPPKAAELFQTIQSGYRRDGDSPLMTQRKVWFAFLVAIHESKVQRLTGPEFYNFLVNEQAWRNDLAQGLVAEYDLAMELLDFIAERRQN